MNGVAAYGHWGRPLLAFPTERGDAGEFERLGMLDALGGLLADGRVKLYCVDSFDRESWSNRDIALEERALRHGVYEAWILEQVVPFIRHDCGGAAELIACGASLGAFHAANFALKRADVFPLAICLSGNYDPASWDSWDSWGERGDAAYFNNPMDSVAHLGGDHLEWLRRQVSLLLVCGQGSGRTRPERSSRRGASRRCWPPRASDANSTSGGTTYPTIGRPGAPSWLITCHASAEEMR
jgi:esterase/lipase superfamily enzyme